MIDAQDNRTKDMLKTAPEKRGRGRPFTGNAKTNAQRQLAYRLKRKRAITDSIGNEINATTQTLIDQLGALTKIIENPDNQDSNEDSLKRVLRELNKRYRKYL